MYVEKRARNDQAIDKDINRGCVGSADVHGASVRGMYARMRCVQGRTVTYLFTPYVYIRAGNFAQRMRHVLGSYTSKRNSQDIIVLIIIIISYIYIYIKCRFNRNYCQ